MQENDYSENPVHGLYESSYEAIKCASEVERKNGTEVNVYEMDLHHGKSSKDSKC